MINLGLGAVQILNASAGDEVVQSVVPSRSLFAVLHHSRRNIEACFCVIHLWHYFGAVGVNRARSTYSSSTNPKT